MASKTNQDAGRLGEIGVSGLRVQSGMIMDEFVRELQGHRGRQTFRQMSRNDSTIAAFLHAIETLVRGVEWRTEPADDSDQALEAAEFAESVRNDMSHTWDDFQSEVLTFLVYGWSYHEVVLKRRQGPDRNDPSRRSKFSDGLIGVRKLAPRAQHTLDRWQIDDDGGINGMWQWPPDGGNVFIPIERALLFRTKTNGGSPEGQSILRQSYRPWYFKQNIEMTEAIGIERELAGMPVAYVPNEVLTDPARSEERNAYERIVRDLRYNEQAGLVLPSEPYRDGEGNPTSQRLVEVELMSSGGTRAIDTGAVVKRYQQDIARSVLADFLMLGSDSAGSFALSKSKTELFLQSLESYLGQIRDTLNRHLLPRLWRLNGFDVETMPHYEFGEVAKTDLDELGTFLRNIAGAGIPLGPDDELEAELRNRADLPERTAEE